MKGHGRKNLLKRKVDEPLAIYLLKLLGVGALFTAASILSPTFLYVFLKRYLRYKLSSRYSNSQIGRSLRYLKIKKFIAYENKASSVRLTALGRKKLTRLAFDEIAIEMTKWDGRWRIVTFDIPENLAPARRIFRDKLKVLGFFHFQRSVFLLPFACEAEIRSAARYLGIEDFVYILAADRFAGDSSLLKKFGL